jgi:hypothetical protein
VVRLLAAALLLLLLLLLRLPARPPGWRLKDVKTAQSNGAWLLHVFIWIKGAS